MKTNYLKKCIFAGLVLTVFVGICSAKGKTDASKYYYDCKGAKGLAESQTVCVWDENNSYLLPHVKYLFEYDASGRVIEKKGLIWDSTKRDWVNSKLYQFTYTNLTVVSEFARWNKQKGCYDEFSERMVYNVEADMLTSCSFYRRDSLTENWNLNFSHTVSVPTNTLWNETRVLLADVEK